MSTQLERLYDAFATSSLGRGPRSRGLATRAADLQVAAPSVEPHRTNEWLMGFLARHAHLEAVAVVEDGRPIGLVNRHAFMEAYARPYARELFSRRSLVVWMDERPLIVDGATPIETLVAKAVEVGPKALKDGFVTTSGGKYAGLGTGFAILEAMSAVEAVKTRQLLESIDYASRIQRSHLRASDGELARCLPDHSLIWEPRDVVGGDCYFFREVEGGLFGAVLDCTGHSVPGAFMTLIALSFLEHAIGGQPAGRDPGSALAGLNRYIHRVLGQALQPPPPGGAAVPAPGSDEGLDGACFWLAPDGAFAEVASARLTVMVVQPGAEAELFAADTLSVGYADTPQDQRWSTRRVTLRPRSVLAVSTDGVIDQVGGPKRVAYGKARLAHVLREHGGLPANRIADGFRADFTAWQSGERRRDDVTLFLCRTEVKR